MWVEKTPNGKFKACERYKDPLTGKLKKVSVTIEKDNSRTRKTAQEELQRRIEELVSADPQHENYKLPEILEYYIQHQTQSGIQANTIRRNKTVLNSMVGLLGDVPARDLTARYIMSQLGASDIENTTKNTYLLRFKAMIHWAYKYDYVDDIRYLDKLDRFPDQSARAKIADKFLEAEEIPVLLNGMTVERWKLLTQFLLLSGLRIGEAIALDKKDLTDVISVTKTMDIGTGERKSRTKTDSSTREVFIQPELADVIKDINRFVLIDQVRNGYRTRLFLPDKNGSFVRYPAYAKYFRENCEALLHRRLTPHALRHTHVSLLAAEGMSLEAIARRVGHEDSKMTKDIYFHVTEKLKKRDQEEISRIKIL